MTGTFIDFQISQDGEWLLLREAGSNIIFPSYLIWHIPTERMFQKLDDDKVKSRFPGIKGLLQGAGFLECDPILEFDYDYRRSFFYDYKRDFFYEPIERSDIVHSGHTWQTKPGEIHFADFLDRPQVHGYSGTYDRAYNLETGSLLSERPYRYGEMPFPHRAWYDVGDNLPDIRYIRQHCPDWLIKKVLPQNSWVNSVGLCPTPQDFRGMALASKGQKAPERANDQGPMHLWRTVGLGIPCRVASPQSPTPFPQLSRV